MRALEESKNAVKEGLPVTFYDKSGEVIWRSDGYGTGTAMYSDGRNGIVRVLRRYVLSDSLKDVLVSRIEASSFPEEDPEARQLMDEIEDSDEILFEYSREIRDNITYSDYDSLMDDVDRSLCHVTPDRIYFD